MAVVTSLLRLHALHFDPLMAEVVSRWMTTLAEAFTCAEWQSRLPLQRVT